MNGTKNDIDPATELVEEDDEQALPEQEPAIDLAADAGTKTAKQALDDTAAAWERINRRMGARSQTVQWKFLKSLYPENVRGRLT